MTTADRPITVRSADRRATPLGVRWAVCLATGLALTGLTAGRVSAHPEHHGPAHVAQGSAAHAGHHGAHQAPGPSAAVRSGVDIALPDLTLVRDDGRSVPLREALGEGPVFVNFVFTTCTSVCPVMSQIFAETQSRLRRDGGHARFVSISIDPLQDTPQRLSAYAKRLEAGASWRFLTGTPAASVAVQKAFGTYTGDKMNHPVATFFRPRADADWVRLDGFARPDELLRELARGNG